MVRRALWSRPDAGASVMVGSGFSRNARPIRSGIRELPLWSDIAKEIENELHPYDPRSPIPSEALRLAQEYNIKFGRSELHRLLSELIQEDSYTPGDLHPRLLRLPWRDVFTTNWDRLLERASSDVAERAYDVLLNKDQIPLMSQPRIVKLHGSFPAQFPLIITKEDYETYPREYAPFVNTVQQAMMETTLCLIGFSGDDPNFIQWLEWVRKNLGESAPRIYLAGWLNLSSEERRELEEDRGVLPIDLINHPQAQNWPEKLQHRYATEWILHTLEQGKPYDVTTWPTVPEQQDTDIPDYLHPVAKVASYAPKKHLDIERHTDSPLYGNESPDRIRQVIETWSHNRSLYPGWLILPSGQRTGLKMRTDDWELRILRSLQELSPVERLNAIRELIWLREIMLERLTHELENAAREVLDAIDCEKKIIKDSKEIPDNWTEVREAWRTVALALVTDARLDCNHKLFDHRLKSLEPFSGDDSNVGHRMQQERCLWAIYSLHFEDLNKLLDDWDVENSDPEWMLRKAALLTESRRYDESRLLLQRALNLSRQSFSKNADVASASREGWVLMSTMSMNNSQATWRRWAELASQNADAWTEKVRITDEIGDSDRKRETPSFDLGTRRGTGFHFSNVGYRRLIASYRAVRLSEVTGLPPTSNPDNDYFGSMIVSSEILRLAADELVDINPELAMRIVLRVSASETDETLERVMSRTRIASLSSESAIDLAEICIRLLNYSLSHLLDPNMQIGGISSYARASVASEALSRLVMRLPDEMVNTALDIAIKIYRMDHVGLLFGRGNSVNHLLSRSWESLPKEYRSTRVFDIMALDISRHYESVATERLPDPAIVISDEDLPSKLTTDQGARIREIVTFLIQGLYGGGDAHNRALLRLIPLMTADLLTSDEKSDIANALWGNSDPILNASSGDGTLFDWIYLVMPELEDGQSERSFRHKWLHTVTETDDSDMSYTPSIRMLTQVGAAVSKLRDLGYLFPISPQEEQLIASHIEGIVEIISSDGFTETVLMFPLVNMAQLASEITFPEDIAENLLHRIGSMFESQHDTQGPFDGLVTQMRLSIGFALVPGLIKSMPDHFDSISQWLRIGLASDDEEILQNAMSSLRVWISASDHDEEMKSPPDDIVREIGLIIASRRKIALPDALWCADTVFETGTDSQRTIIHKSVLRGLEYLAEELRYDREHDESQDVPLLRLLCVQLAKTLAECGFEHEPIVARWLQIGNDDPFPEVRRMADISESEQDAGEG